MLSKKSQSRKKFQFGSIYQIWMVSMSWPRYAWLFHFLLILDHLYFQAELETAFGSFKPVASLNPYFTKLDLCKIRKSEIKISSSSRLFYRQRLIRLDINPDNQFQVQLEMSQKLEHFLNIGLVRDGEYLGLYINLTAWSVYVNGDFDELFARTSSPAKSTYGYLWLSFASKSPDSNDVQIGTHLDWFSKNIAKILKYQKKEKTRSSGKTFF